MQEKSKPMTWAHRVISALVAILLIAIGCQPAWASSPLSAKVGALPGVTHSVEGGQAPFVIEFSGGLAETSTSCSELGLQAKIWFRWSTELGTATDEFSRGVPGLLSYPEGTFYRTLGVTSTGIKCEVSHVVGWGNESLYSINAFKVTEEAMALQVEVFSDSQSIGVSSGRLYNPTYLPYSASIVGLSRGDSVGASFAFSVAGTLPNRSAIKSEALSVNGSSCNGNDCILLRTGPFDYKALLSRSFVSESDGALAIQVNWEVLNPAGYRNELATPPLVLQLDKSQNSIAAADLSSAGLYLNTSIACSDNSERTGQKLNCRVYPMVDTQSRASASSGSFVSTALSLEIQTWSDSGGWRKAKITSATPDRWNTFALVAPANRDYLAIRAVSKTWARMGEADTAEYGRKPGNFNNYLTLPSQILWGEIFRISVAPAGGTASRCTFYGPDERTAIASGIVKNGHLTVTAKLKWASYVGQRSTIVIYASCRYGSKSYMDYSVTSGIR